jgi:hypothetical protein
LSSNLAVDPTSFTPTPATLVSRLGAVRFDHNGSPREPTTLVGAVEAS